MVTTLVVAGVVFSVVGLYLSFVYREAASRVEVWEKQFLGVVQLPSGVQVRYGMESAILAGERTSQDSLERALILAVACLRGIWADAEAALAGARIYVKLQDTWIDGVGRRVAGLALYDGTLVVGANLEALCHELAHLCERKIDRTEDFDHARWEARGIERAIANYRTGLVELLVVRR